MANQADQSAARNQAEPFVQEQIDALTRERDEAVEALRVLVDLNNLRLKLKSGKADTAERAYYRANAELAWLGAAAIVAKYPK